MVENREGRIIRVAVYILLVLSLSTFLFLGDHLWLAAHEHLVPWYAPFVPPVIFTAFVAIYAVDRWLLVYRHHYPVPRAMFQVALSLVFLTLLLRQQASKFVSVKQADVNQQAPALLLLGHREDGVRAAACELLVGELPGNVFTQVVEHAHNDLSAQVRDACGRALGRSTPTE